MAVIRIIVADCIMTDNLFQEEGYDVERSADKLADLKGQIIVDYLDGKYPGVEIYADIAIQKEAGSSRPLEVMAYVGEETIDHAESAALQQQLTRHLAECIVDLSWAVRAA